MEVNVTALQGKIFKVELIASAGTNYSWCVSDLPSGIWFVGAEVIPVAGNTMVGQRVIQEFYFCAVDAPEEGECKIKFALTCLSDFSICSEQREIDVIVIPKNTDEFIKYSENAVAAPNRVDNLRMDYGYPGGLTDASMLYGFRCEAQAPIMKYGYPCSASAMIPGKCSSDQSCAASNDMNAKYGYFWDDQDSNVKYGYPCGVQDAVMKYGYPCGVQDAVMKYGYPCGVQDAIVKYGAPCSDVSNSRMPYGVIYNK